MRWAFVIGMHLFSAGIHVRGREVSVTGVLAHRIKCVTEPGRATSRDAATVPPRPASALGPGHSDSTATLCMPGYTPSPRVRCLDSGQALFLLTYGTADRPPRHLSIKPTGQTARAHSSSLSERVSATLAHYAQANSGPPCPEICQPHSVPFNPCCRVLYIYVQQHVLCYSTGFGIS